MKGLFWRIWAVLLVLSILWLGWCMRIPQPAEAQQRVLESVVAKEFHLVDDQGRACASMSVLPDGSPYLDLYHARGESRASLSLFGGPHLTLSSDGMGANLAAYSDGSAWLGFADARGKLRVELEVDSHGSAHLNLYDVQGKPRVGVGADADGTPSLYLFDARGRVLFWKP